MKEFFHLIGAHWRERYNRNCRAKYKRIEKEMERWRLLRKKVRA